jgi:hypothetical protein
MAVLLVLCVLSFVGRWLFDMQADWPYAMQALSKCQDSALYVSRSAVCAFCARAPGKAALPRMSVPALSFPDPLEPGGRASLYVMLLLRRCALGGAAACEFSSKASPVVWCCQLLLCQPYCYAGSPALC